MDGGRRVLCLRWLLTFSTDRRPRAFVWLFAIASMMCSVNDFRLQPEPRPLALIAGAAALTLLLAWMRLRELSHTD